MVISFDEIVQQKIPFVQMEFDSTRAQQGPSVQEYKLLMFGQMLAAGAAVANEIVKVDSLSKAKSLFGDNSDLAFMVQSALANNKVTDLYCLPVDDNGAGAAAAGTVTTVGTATEAGTLHMYISGRRISVAVAVGDDQDAVATAIVAAIAAYTDDMLPITAAVDGINADEVDFTARHKGETGNNIDIRFNYQSGDEFPAGITASVTTPMAAGATNPVLTTAIANIGEAQYNLIAIPWLDATSLTAIEAELLTRWGAAVALEGQAIAAETDTTGNLDTLGNSRNSQFLTIFGEVSIPSMPLEIAAAAAAQIAGAAQNDPARPFQTLELKGILPPSITDRLTATQRNSLLGNGIATMKVSAASTMLIERAITTYKTDVLGNPDTSLYDITTMLTLSYLRYDLRAFIARQYPRYKLANDSVRVQPGQAVVTPGIMRAEIISRARIWNRDLVIIEDFEQFKSDLVVERNALDVNRLDVLMSPNLVNQLRQTAIKTQFLV